MGLESNEDVRQAGIYAGIAGAAGVAGLAYGHHIYKSPKNKKNEPKQKKQKMTPEEKLAEKRAEYNMDLEERRDKKQAKADKKQAKRDKKQLAEADRIREHNLNLKNNPRKDKNNYLIDNKSELTEADRIRQHNLDLKNKNTALFDTATPMSPTKKKRILDNKALKTVLKAL